jgi:hypothetical protein
LFEIPDKQIVIQNLGIDERSFVVNLTENGAKVCASPSQIFRSDNPATGQIATHR